MNSLRILSVELCLLYFSVQQGKPLTDLFRRLLRPLSLSCFIQTSDVTHLPFSFALCSSKISRSFGPIAGLHFMRKSSRARFLCTPVWRYECFFMYNYSVEIAHISILGLEAVTAARGFFFGYFQLQLCELHRNCHQPSVLLHWHLLFPVHDKILYTAGGESFH